MLFRDLPRRAAQRRAGGGRENGRGPGPGGPVQLAFQAVEPAGAALGLCRGRAGEHPAHETAARLCRGAAAGAVAGGRGEAAWDDEAHVAENRALYAEKYRLADEVFAGVAGCHPPEAGFFLWLPVADGEAATVKLWREAGVRVLPGAYLAREVDGQTPGADRIRVAMVAAKDDMRRGLIRLRDCLYAR